MRKIPARVSHGSLHRLLVSVLATCVVVVASAGTALAEDAADCRVLEIKASTGAASMDEELKPIAKKLKKPPFSAWQKFELVKKHDAKAPLMKPITFKLVDGGALSLLYKERSDSKARKPRLRIGMTMDDASGKRKADITLKVDSGDFTLVGRDAGKDGSSQLLAIRCGVK